MTLRVLFVASRNYRYAKSALFWASSQGDPFPLQNIHTLMSMLSWLLPPDCLYDTEISYAWSAQGCAHPFATVSHCPVLTPSLLCTSGHGCWRQHLIWVG